MGYFELIERYGHEQIVFCSDAQTGLRAFIGIHNTTLGPSLGGCRMKAYASEEEAFKDVVRLSQAMTYKSSLAGLDLGGGKSVVILNSPEQKTPELLTAFAKRINALGGLYIGAGDIGSTAKDMAWMKQTTPWVTGMLKEDGGLGESAVLTSFGVFQGIRAAVKTKLGRDELDGLKVIVQGTGKVGFHLIKHLVEAGAKVLATDINEQALAHAVESFPGVEAIDLADSTKIEADILSPNAVGGLITPEVAQTVPVSIIAGGANNILSEEEAGTILHQRGILFAPDYLINCGGIITVACEIQHKTEDDARAMTAKVYERTLHVFDWAQKHQIPPHQAAYQLAVERVQAKKEGRPEPVFA